MTDHLARLTATAHRASTAITGLSADLAIAALPNAETGERLNALESAFRKWRSLVAAMTALEQAAPNTARKAYDHMDRIADFTTRNAETQGA